MSAVSPPRPAVPTLMPGGPVHAAARRSLRRPRPRPQPRRSAFPAVSVVVPTRNEARNLEVVLPKIAAVRPAVHEIIVVDGHSKDDSIGAARRTLPWVRAITQTRKGKGNAMACGFAAATGDVIVMFDADGSADPAEIPAFVSALVAGADFAKGSRFAPGGGSDDITLLRRTGNAGLNGVANALFGTSYTDLCYGYNAFWADLLPLLDLPDPATPAPADGMLWGDGFEIETVLNCRVAAAGLRITEVPSVERQRIFGETNLRTFADGTRVLRTLLSEHRRADRRKAARTPALSRAGPQPVSTRRTPHVTSPAPVLPRATVVICVYTEKRWDDIVAAVGSVLAQDVRAAEVLVVVDHNPALLERARGAFGEKRAGAGERAPPGSVRGAQHRGRRRLRRRRGLPRRRRRRAAGLAARAARPVRRPRRGRGGRGGAPAVPRRAGRACCPRGGTGADATGELDWVVGCTYTGQPTEQAEVRNLMGCNMSLRREVFARVGGFAEDLGRIGRNPLGCEETELCIRIRQSYRRMGREARIVFEPAAQVDHRVSADRVRWAYLRRRSWSEGLSKAAVSRLVGQRRRPVHRARLRGHGAAGRGGPGAAGAAARVGARDRDGAGRDGRGVPARQAARRDVGGAAAGGGRRRPTATALPTALPAANRTGGA